MKYIDLDIKSYKDNRLTSLDKAIESHEIIVLLGIPGSGKTSLLKKYEAEHASNAKFIKIKSFLKLSHTLDDGIDILLLDGLDEYRSISTDKTSVITELGNKLSQLERKKIVINCREMDWFGEYDKKALKSEIKKEAVVYGIEPLNNNQKVELAELLGIEYPQKFVDKFANYGFLENPQMFVMLARLYEDKQTDSIGSKKDLYFTFVKNAREQNPDYTLNQINKLSSEEILKYAGYLASFCIFSGQDELDDKQFIDEICNFTQGYSREKLETVLKTNLFYKRTFIHRTVAEFVLAYFLCEYKLKNKNLISFRRVKNLFALGGKIPTELRGTYAWLCSLVIDDRLIEIDPYYQAIHGDNSFFNSELKKRIVLQVKKYAQTNPYFFEFGHTMELEGFYNTNLDTFFMDEFEAALKLKNHYILFIINAIVTTPILSSEMRGFLKNKIEDESISGRHKKYIIDSKAFQDDTDFMLEILHGIKIGKIKDQGDNLKECLLRILYPEKIGYDKIADYLMLYGKKDYGNCYYLFETLYEEKYALVDRLHQLSYNPQKSPKLLLPENVKTFINDYFMETLLKFEKGQTAKDIYRIIKHFKDTYYKDYERLKFQSFRYAITDELKQSDDRLYRLASELFSLYIDDILLEQNKEGLEGKDIYAFDFLFNLKFPIDASKILLSKMSIDKAPKINIMLFSWALNYAKKDDTSLMKELVSKAQDFEFESLLYNWQHPQKTEWQIEEEKQEKEQEEEDKRILQDNEDYFKSKTDEELQRNFNVLFSIARYLYTDKKYRERETHLTSKTLERLTNILKNAIFKELIDPELLTLQSLANDSPQAMRYIDEVYYTSCQLNENFDFDKIPKEFLKYLYINTLLHRNIALIIKDEDNARFIERIEEKPDFAKEILKEYINYLVKAYLGNHEAAIIPYIRRDENIKNLKDVAVLCVLEKNTIVDTILNNFLKAYNFNIELKDLIKLNDESFNEENKNTIFALRYLLEDKKDDFNVTMAVSLHLLFRNDHFERFSNLSSDKKVKIIDYMMMQFNTEESIEYKNGFQSGKAQCASFLERSSLNNLNEKELLELQSAHLGNDDIWTNRIAHAINQLGQKNADQIYKPYGIEKIKNFILSDDILSLEDFFVDICEKINLLKQEIEDNRNKDKELFYGQNEPKNENDCRDVIMLRLKDKYGDDIELTKEKYEGDNRADINIKYKANTSFEVQVECKKDNNSDIDTGIPNQLIGKYLSSSAQYGIYLIFYFGKDKRNKEKLHDDLVNTIPPEYKNKIEVICIDLSKVMRAV